MSLEIDGVVTQPPREAPGWPGISPRWTTSTGAGVGTSLGPSSRVWFTLSHGILNEVYYPRVDQACLRDLGLIVTDGDGIFRLARAFHSHPSGPTRIDGKSATFPSWWPDRNHDE